MTAALRRAPNYSHEIFISTVCANRTEHRMNSFLKCRSSTSTHKVAKTELPTQPSESKIGSLICKSEARIERHSGHIRTRHIVIAIGNSKQADGTGSAAVVSQALSATAGTDQSTKLHSTFATTLSACKTLVSSAKLYAVCTISHLN